jgi:hypothetical protein
MEILKQYKTLEQAGVAWISPPARNLQTRTKTPQNPKKNQLKKGPS